jgi:hypothetical protein
MEDLSNYTTAELKAELKRRAEIARARRAEEMKNALMCRNCIHCQGFSLSKWRLGYLCMARVWGKKHPRNYKVSPSTKACEKFERNT